MCSEWNTARIISVSTWPNRKVKKRWKTLWKKVFIISGFVCVRNSHLKLYSEDARGENLTCFLLFHSVLWCVIPRKQWKVLPCLTTIVPLAKCVPRDLFGILQIDYNAQAAEAKCTNESEYDFKIILQDDLQDFVVGWRRGICSLGRPGRQINICFHWGHQAISVVVEYHKKIHWRPENLWQWKQNITERIFFGANALSEHCSLFKADVI